MAFNDEYNKELIVQPINKKDVEDIANAQINKHAFFDANDDEPLYSVGKIMCLISIAAVYNGTEGRRYNVKLICSKASCFKALDNGFNAFRNLGLSIAPVVDNDSFTAALNAIYTAGAAYFAQALITLLQNTYLVVDRNYSKGTNDFTILNGDDAGLSYFASNGTFTSLGTEIGNEVASFTQIKGYVND